VESIDEAEAQGRLGEILDEALQRPIIIQRQSTDIAVLMSIAFFERLRAGAVQDFLNIRNQVAGEAAAAGLTEDQLSELLADNDLGENDLTEEQRAELDLRWKEHLTNPGSAILWEDVRRRLRGRS
jgi:putative addiction module component (TIGR02574 family)